MNRRDWLGVLLWGAVLAALAGGVCYVAMQWVREIGGAL